MLVYQTDARIWLGEESRRERRPVTLGSISHGSLDTLAERGFRWLWLRGVWDTGTAGREAARRRSRWLDELKEALPDLELGDIDGSPFAVREHRVRPEMGGDDALEELRADLARRDVRLILDFAPDSVSLDHPWVDAHPEFLAEETGTVSPRASRGGALRLNHDAPGLGAALLRELEKVAALSDGVCAVHGTGGEEAGQTFWRAAISRIRSVHPRYVFLAEGVRGLDGATARAGFDLAVDPVLLDRLLALDATGVREHLTAAAPAGRRAVRFLEGYGGPRAARTFPEAAYFAAAVVAYLSPGVKLFHDGQIEGRRAPHDARLSRRASEPSDREIQAFHERLLEILARPEAAEGASSIEPIRGAWEGNSTWKQFVVSLEKDASGVILLSVVNYGPLQGQCYVDLAPLEPRGREWVFQDLFSLQVYERDGNDLAARGFYVDLPPWDYNVFEVRPGRPL